MSSTGTFSVSDVESVTNRIDPIPEVALVPVNHCAVAGSIFLLKTFFILGTFKFNLLCNSAHAGNAAFELHNLAVFVRLVSVVTHPCSFVGGF